MLKTYMSYNKKFKILNQQKFPNHRHGWDYVVKILQELNDDKGTLLETTFDVKATYSFNEYKNQFPIKESWVGFSHLTPIKPTNNKYINFYNLHDTFVDTKVSIKQSLENCKGLFVLSKYVKNYLINLNLNIPISTLYHSTELNVKKFNINNYNKCITHCGFFYRKFNSFVKLNTQFTKQFLFPGHHTQLATNIAKEDISKNCNNNEINAFNSIKQLNSLSNNEYDNLLSENLVFVDFYDSSANNTIIECIARNNPIIVNKHPAVVEYLGQDYPLYFDNLEEASEKINTKNIALAHDYLINKDKQFLSSEYFLESITNSKIYKALN